MVAIPLLSSAAGTETGEFVQTFPLNLEPVIVDSKISRGQLKAAPGAIQQGIGPGADRGGIVWNATHYRVMGSKFLSPGDDGTLTIIGDVGDGYRCSFDYSFDRLIIRSGANLYYYNAALGLVQVTDPNLGTVVDAMWIDGYTMTTDGTYIVVTELDDPMTIRGLKFGSAEEDPDPITGLLRYRDETYVFGRYTIQLFENVGGEFFPFETVRGGFIPFGCVGPLAKCLFGDGFAFVGSARGERLNVFVGGQGQAREIGCRALCDALSAISDCGCVEVEERVSRNERRLFVHLPAESWVYLMNASVAAGEPIWYRIKTDASGYRLRNAVDVYEQTFVGDTQSGAYGVLSDNTLLHWGIDPGWQFDCGMIYNQALGAIVHSIELVGLPGRGGDTSVFVSWTRDGETYSQERCVSISANARNKRIAWRPHWRIGNYMGLRFRGFGTGLPGIASCEAKAAPLSS